MPIVLCFERLNFFIVFIVPYIITKVKYYPEIYSATKSILSVPIKIGNNNFVVEFATAEMKGQDPEILSLYNAAVKKQATTSSSNALSPESNAIMQPETPVVKQLNQRTQANGMYDPELNVIVLGRNFNTTTLPHELSHFWLNNTFQWYKNYIYY